MAEAVAEERCIVSDDRTFLSEIEQLSGQNIKSCYQCGECTGGCPVAFTADIMPNHVTRLVQLGMDKEVLRSSMIWLCVGCETCATRCPRGIEISRVNDALRETAINRGEAAAEPAVKTFHQTFLRSIERMGRVHEVSMLGEYKLRSRDLFSDLLLGAKMFLKGKLVLVPKWIKGMSEIKTIFAKTKRNA